MKRMAALLLGAAPALAIAGLEMDSELSFRGGFWSGDRSLSRRTDRMTASMSTRSRLLSDTLGQGVFDAWLGGQNSGEARHALVREAYWRTDIEALSIKAGRQIIVWGRADGLNPTDNLSPRDFTKLTPEDGDQRYGNTALNLSYDGPVGTLTAIWFPEAATHTIPLARLDNVVYDVQRPDGAQWALKWDLRRENVDGSLSYFDGIDPMPDLVPGLLAGSAAQVKVQSQRTRFLGADISLTQGGTLWRAEAALSATRHKGAEDFRHKRPQLWVVGGGEWRMFSTSTLGLQLTYTHVYDYASAKSLPPGFEREVAIRQAATSGQTSKNQLGFTWRLADTWFNDSLSVEMNGVNARTSGAGVARLKADYALTDRVKLTGGFDYYYGPGDTFFGQLSGNKTTYAQLQYAF